MVIVKVIRSAEGDNDLAANEVRSHLSGHGVLTLNFLGGPGCGKTSLLNATLARMRNEFRFGAIFGDLYTSRDAERIAGLGVPVVQINTEGASHLGAHMIKESLAEFDLDVLDCLFIENVGNLICPGNYDLGEDYRVVLLSTAEGSDTVDKYPRMFRQASVNIITKTDLLEHVAFNVHDVTSKLQVENPDAPVFEMSAKSGSGVEDWCRWLRENLTQAGMSGH